MLFQRKYDRMKKFQKEQLGDAERALETENLADKLEKNDALALILSALIVILPVALLFLLIISAVGYFLIVH